MRTFNLRVCKLRPFFDIMGGCFNFFLLLPSSSPLYLLLMSSAPIVPVLQLDSKGKQGRMIHVTHQIPYEVTPSRTQQGLAWSFTPRHGHSAMYAGMQSLEPTFETFRIGWTGPIHYQQQQQQPAYDTTAIQVLDTPLPFAGDNDADQFTEEEKYELVQQLYHQYGCLPLFLDNDSVNGHYYGYCKTSKCRK